MANGEGSRRGRLRSRLDVGPIGEAWPASLLSLGIGALEGDWRGWVLYVRTKEAPCAWPGTSQKAEPVPTRVSQLVSRGVANYL
jgi:hypothetical protein